jgi:hypothetical protein
MLNDWGVHHLHLGTGPDPQGWFIYGTHRGLRFQWEANSLQLQEELEAWPVVDGDPDDVAVGPGLVGEYVE